MATRSYALRPATADDGEFVYALRRTVYREHVIHVWGKWDEQWQQDYFRGHFDPTDSRIVCIDEEPVGHVVWRWEPGRLFLASIELLPAWQRRGIGSSIIRDLGERARRHGLPLELQVMKINDDARRLYERLGFAPVPCARETHHQMRLT